MPEWILGAQMACPSGPSVPEWRARTGARMKTIMCPNGKDNVPEWYCNEPHYVPEWRKMCPNGNHYVTEWKR